MSFPAARADASAPGALLRLVPEDMALGMVARDLRGHARRLADSPFAKKISKSPLIASMFASAKQGGDAAWRGEIEKALGISMERLVEEVVGDSWLIAYRPGPPGNAEQEEGMFALWSRNPKLLSRLVEHVVSSQRQAGSIKQVTEKRHQGHAFRLLESEKDTNAIWSEGNQFVFTTSESNLLRIIERHDSPATKHSLGKELRELGASEKMLTLWIRPRAFDNSLRTPNQNPNDSKAHAAKEFFKYWQTLDGLAFSLDCQEDLSLTLHAIGRTADLPAAARELLAGLSPRCPTEDKAGYGSIASLGLRIDMGALFNALSGFVPGQDPEKAKLRVMQQLGAAFGPETVEGLFQKVGPTWQMRIFAPTREDPRWVPQMLFGVSFPAQEHAFVANFAHLLASTIVVGSNHAKPASMSLRADAQTGFWHLSGTAITIPEWKPAFAMDREHLWLASDSGILNSLRETKHIRSADNVFLRLSLQESALYLRNKKSHISKYVAKEKNLPPAQIESGIDSILLVLDQLKMAELDVATSPKSLNLTLRVRMTESLK